METAAVQYQRINIIAVDIPDDTRVHSLSLTVQPPSQSSVAANDGGERRRIAPPYFETDGPAACLVYFTK